MMSLLCIHFSTNGLKFGSHLNTRENVERIQKGFLTDSKYSAIVVVATGADLVSFECKPSKCVVKETSDNFEYTKQCLIKALSICTDLHFPSELTKCLFILTTKNWKAGGLMFVR